MIDMLLKRFFIKRVTDILAEGGCEFSYNAENCKIYTEDGHDATDLLYTLFCHYDNIESTKWKEDFCKKFGIPFELLFCIPREETKTSYKFVHDKKPKVYISGKVSGLSEKVYKNNFNSAELYLTGLGYDAVNPVSEVTIPNGTWEDYMRRDIKLLCDCDYIYLLEGWEDSDGASLEKLIADNLGIKQLILDENGVVV